MSGRRRAAAVVGSLLVLGGPAWADDATFGVAHIEAVLLSLPETPAIDAELEAIAREDAERIRQTSKYREALLQSYHDAAAERSVDAKAQEGREAEIRRVEREIEDLQRAAERRLLERSAALRAPLVARVQKAVDEVAAERGYAYVLNVTGGELPNVLWVDPSIEITKDVAKKLGIPTGPPE